MNGGDLVDNKSGGGVEDCATVDQPVTLSVASGYALVRDQLLSTKKERAAHCLRGLLPPAILGQELQQKRLMHILRQYKVPLQRYVAMMDLQVYTLLIVEFAFYRRGMNGFSTSFSSTMWRSFSWLFTLRQLARLAKSKGAFPGALRQQSITNLSGERFLKYWKTVRRDVYKSSSSLMAREFWGSEILVVRGWEYLWENCLYTALGGVRPSACLPVTIDVGMNNEKLLNDEFYIGLRQWRETGQEYAELFHEFMSAVKQNYGEKVLIQVTIGLHLFSCFFRSFTYPKYCFQFEDFANHNALELLARYSSSNLVLKDDIQGIASVVLSGVMRP
ncbi:ATP-dependent protease La (LON) domain protein, putative isoform 1 [Hibiscus syriacus]|uniref:ATP-dependent protease La (LON) domain protein, putative isoform 1 n=1 Tax=Hibiscus syriacus TaxID=106335 RepID=A0A6A2XD32_HIBSY|nr:ATP-dependent protease La (LON) domain protein, putative isoform 1 [Hibiscus syriacus]